MIAASSLLMLGFLFIIIGFFSPVLYFLVVLGQCLSGVAGAILFSLPAVIAQLWFHEYQIGLATGIGMLGASTASVLGCILPPILIKFDRKNSHLSLTTADLTINPLDFDHPETWMQYDKSVYHFLYLTMLATALLVLVLLCAFIPDKPQYPPSLAQYLKRTQKNKSSLSFREFLIQIRSLIFDYKFVAGNVIATLVYYMYYFEELSAELIVTRLGLHFNSLSTEQISGIIIATISVGTIPVNIFSGILLDKFKKYYLQSNVSAGLVLLTSITNLLSVYYKIFVALMVLCFLFGLAKRICFITVIDS